VVRGVECNFYFPRFENLVFYLYENVYYLSLQNEDVLDSSRNYVMIGLHDDVTQLLWVIRKAYFNDKPCC